MKRMLLLLLLTAILASGVMPMRGMVAQALTVPGASTMTADDTRHPHAPKTASHNAPCPHAATPVDTEHGGPMPAAVGHCSACLTLAATILFTDPGRPFRMAQAPGAAPELKSMSAAPLERPPRLKG